jgi:hypothetical protein
MLINTLINIVSAQQVQQVSAILPEHFPALLNKVHSRWSKLALDLSYLSASSSKWLISYRKINSILLQRIALFHIN